MPADRLNEDGIGIFGLAADAAVLASIAEESKGRERAYKMKKDGERECAANERNLIAAARRYPGARFCGLDISDEMLETARAAVAGGSTG